ncbi:MAG: precorrin-3B C(17)-methyltransferase [Firmicutes bacterium]|nr:precorrin-3B C(17)-methyltransferase [Bacillota bacterium]
MKKNPTIYVVGLGPGTEAMTTPQAERAMAEADVIVGYTVYLDLIRDRFPEKEMLSTPMKQETERCRMCFDEAGKGKDVAMVCSGDPGVYGMASIMLEMAEQYRESVPAEVVVIPGITAAMSGAAVLGAPLSHDFCVISLSDLLTPWELIEKRLRAAAAGDFCVALYNPSSHKRADYLNKACTILMEEKSPETACGWVRNIGREGEEYRVMTLAELAEEKVDMFTTCFIGNSQTRINGDRLVTPRGYRL